MAPPDSRTRRASRSDNVRGGSSISRDGTRKLHSGQPGIFDPGADPVHRPEDGALRHACRSLALTALAASTQIDCAGSIHASEGPSRSISASSEQPAVASSVTATADQASARRPEAASPHPTDGATHTPGAPADYVVVTGRGQLGPGPGTLAVHLIPPADGALTEGAPLRLEGRAEHISFPPPVETRLSVEQLPLRLEIDVHPRATGPALIDLSYYWCSKGESSACRPVRAKLAVELDLTGTSPGGEVHIEHRAAGVE